MQLFFLGTQQCWDPSDSLANLCSVPPSSVRTGLCVMCMSVSHSTPPAPKERFFSSILTLSCPHCFLSRLWGACHSEECVRGGLPRALTGLTAPVKQCHWCHWLHRSRVTPALCVSKDSSPDIFSSFSISEFFFFFHFWVILGCGGHFNFPLLIVLASLISLGVINWRLALAGIAVIYSLKEEIVSCSSFM